MKMRKPSNDRRRQRAGRWLGFTAIVLLLVAAYAGWRLLSIVQTEKASTAYYAALRTDAAVVAIEAVPPNEAEASAPSVPAEPPQDEAKPDAPHVPAKAFADLKSINPDIVGWLCCEGTKIDYPLVQGDDNAYYLTHMFDKTENKAGALFLDCHNAPDFTDDNNVVYGHHMKNGAMLAGIVEYKAQAFYEAHPVMLLYTPEGDYLVELFGGYVAHDEDVYTAPAFPDGEAMRAYIDDVKAHSTFMSDVEVAPEDRILALVTCSYEVRNARFVLLGKLTRMEQGAS